MPGIGEPAPKLELPGIQMGERRVFSLDEYRGRSAVVVAFYPGDFTFG